MKWIAASAVAFAVAAPAGMLAPRAHAATPAAAGFYQDRPWDQPPDEYRDVQRQGFHDGVEAARHDWDRHSRKDADDHDRYRHPPVAREFHNDYRDGFKHGYDVAMSHIRDERRDHDNDRPY
ncbi:MAG TPA: hypothetical protein VKB38_09695 [Terracidiphilus sp.]|nr:hypothetical protein [Terracidiphilus sp.]